ncbi:MAG: SDR family NAD(P)-dependent oxidoreductase [Solirubrobacteraceae bacterium]
MRSYDGTGRTVLITGAASGIGAGLARRLHTRGAHVALLDRDGGRLEELAATLGRRASTHELDVTDGEALARAAGDVAERFGGLDVAVANAGLGGGAGSLMDGSTDVERVLDVNLMGVWRTDRAVLPHLARSGGYLLNVASLAATLHGPGMGAYPASKAGVEALTNTLRSDARPAGVAVGCAYFGFVDTELLGEALDRPDGRELFDRLPSVLRSVLPRSAAVDVLEDGIARRAARVWAPRWVGPVLYARGLLQPLVERRLA